MQQPLISAYFKSVSGTRANQNAVGRKSKKVNIYEESLKEQLARNRTDGVNSERVIEQSFQVDYIIVRCFFNYTLKNRLFLLKNIDQSISPSIHQLPDTEIITDFEPELTNNNIAASNAVVAQKVCIIFS